jgi:hypothetical protein
VDLLTPSSTPGGRSRPVRLGVLALCLLGAARTASAAGAAALIDWDAPESCLGALDVYARLSSVLGYEPETLGKLSHVRSSVVRTPSGYRLVLEAFEDGRRACVSNASRSERSSAASIRASCPRRKHSFRTLRCRPSPD